MRVSGVDVSVSVAKDRPVEAIMLIDVIAE